MNTFFRSINGRALRGYFQKNTFKFQIIDFGGEKIFHSKSAYTCICLIKNSVSNFIEYVKSSGNNLPNLSPFNIISYESLNAQKGWNLQNVDLLNKIEATGTPFGELFKTRNGIATLKNGIYIFDPIDEDDDYYYLRNGACYPIEKEICKEIINSNKFTRNEQIDSIKEKAIFPYFFEGDLANLLPEDRFQDNYPKAYSYLKSKKEQLSQRDKGKGNYQNWYAYGRNQSLEKFKHKLFFPHLTSSTPNFVMNSDEDLLFYNGLAVIGNNEKELRFLQKLMGSKLFWFYIINSSKPYGSGYYSLGRNYIKSFGIYDFSEQEIDTIIEETDDDKLNSFVESKYKVKL